MELNILHLYYDILNLYGEYGNILKSYGFFHELFADKEYQKIIKDALPHDIFALFNNK